MTVLLVNGSAIGVYDDLLEADKACEWLECQGLASTAAECPLNPSLSLEAHSLAALGREGEQGVILATGERRASAAAGSGVTLSPNRNKKE
jgi:hypothetical protein